MAQNGFCSKDIYLLAGINYPCHTTIPKWALNGLQLVRGSFLQIQIYTKLQLGMPSGITVHQMYKKSTDKRVPRDPDLSRMLFM